MTSFVGTVSSLVSVNVYFFVVFSEFYCQTKINFNILYAYMIQFYAYLLIFHRSPSWINDIP